jgi:hypothetical protein
MKQDITSRVVMCPICGAAFLPGIEGAPDGSACAECESIEEPVAGAWDEND